MGTLQRRPNGNWTARIRINGFPLLSATFPRRPEAIAWAEVQEARIRTRQGAAMAAETERRIAAECASPYRLFRDVIPALSRRGYAASSRFSERSDTSARPDVAQHCAGDACGPERRSDRSTAELAYVQRQGRDGAARYGAALPHLQRRHVGMVSAVAGQSVQQSSPPARFETPASAVHGRRGDAAAGGLRCGASAISPGVGRACSRKDRKSVV